MLIAYSYLTWFGVTLFFLCLFIQQPFGGGGYRLGAAPEEESTYVVGERRQSGSVQDVSHYLVTAEVYWDVEKSAAVICAVPTGACCAEAMEDWL